jgi:hypothetical protein
MENKIEHLKMIQAIISRMSGSLFYLKGWAITLFAGLLSIVAKDTNKELIYLSFFPIVIFWILDGYFLAEERKFRALYDDVRKLPEEKIDFSMDTREYKKLAYCTWSNAFFSPTLKVFYGLQIVFLVSAITVINKEVITFICKI